MKKRDSIDVLFYEGYKGRETPRALLVGNKEMRIKEVISRSRQEDIRSGKRFEVFTCLFEDGFKAKLLIYDSDHIEIVFLG